MSEKANLGHGLFAAALTRGPRAGKTAYYGRVWIKSEGRIRYFTLKGSTEREARKQLGALALDPEKALRERAAREAERTAGPALTFGAMLDRFLREYRSRGDSGYYRNVSVSWRKFFGDVEVGRISRPRVEAYREHLRRDGYSASSIRKYVGALGTLFRWAMESCDPPLATGNPAAGVKRPPEPDREVEVLSREEEAKLLAVSSGALRLLVEWCLETGLRRGEALRLTWAQIDTDSGNILIHKSKTSRSRSVPLTPRLTEILGRATKREDSPLVFHNEAGKPWEDRAASRALETALERADIRKRGDDSDYQGVYNLCRHSFGSRKAAAGVSYGAIAKLMGNSVRVVERHYVRFAASDLKAAMLAGTQPAPTVPPTVTDAGIVTPKRSRNHLQLVAG